MEAAPGRELRRRAAVGAEPFCELAQRDRVALERGIGLEVGLGLGVTPQRPARAGSPLEALAAAWAPGRGQPGTSRSASAGSASFIRRAPSPSHASALSGSSVSASVYLPHRDVLDHAPPRAPAPRAPARRRKTRRRSLSRREPPRRWQPRPATAAAILEPITLPARSAALAQRDAGASDAAAGIDTSRGRPPASGIPFPARNRRAAHPRGSAPKGDEENSSSSSSSSSSQRRPVAYTWSRSVGGWGSWAPTKDPRRAGAPVGAQDPQPNPDRRSVSRRSARPRWLPCGAGGG